MRSVWPRGALWDDEHRCAGGSAALVDALLARPELAARAVEPDEDLVPAPAVE